MMVTLHSLHVQILHANNAHLALVRECIGDFVKVLLTGVSNTLLQPGYKDASLVARLAEPFCLRLNRFCNSFKRSRLRCRFFGLPNVRPSEHTASDLMPKSIPKVVLPCIVDAESSWMAVSTNTEAKYLPEGVMLMVTVFTIPLNLRCSTAGIPLALGIERVPFLKSTLQCCGH